MKCLLEKGSIFGILSGLASADKKVTNAMNAVSVADKSARTKAPYMKGSLSKYANDLIMTFPVLCDNSLPPSTVSMINRAHERNIVTMLELLFASAQFNGTDGMEVLNSIHRNINPNMSMDDYIDAVETISKNAAVSQGVNWESADFRDYVKAMEQKLKEPAKSFPVNSFSERSLNEYTVLNINGRTLVKEDNPYLNDMDDDIYWGSDDSVDRYSKKMRAQQYRDDRAYARNRDAYARHKDDREGKEYARNAKYAKNRDEREQRREEREAERDRRDAEYSRRRDERDERRDAREAERDRRDAEYNKQREEREQRRDIAQARRDAMQDVESQVNVLSRRLLDTDVKKANEMQPTLMIVQYNEMDADGKIYDKKSFVAGVKARLISVDSNDMVERLIAKNRTKINFLNFIRATTGEISFVKDFLFCVGQAKINAKNAVKKGPAASMWNTLENLSIKNNWNRLRKKGNDASCITTLVINQETVNILKKEYDFDLERINNARMIMDAYNLLGIVIADESIEVVKFLYNGNNVFEQQAYSYLERESNDNSYKKVINLIGKMNGR